MKNYTFQWEIRTLVASFVKAFNDVVIKRYNEDKVSEDQIQVDFKYMPKSRVLHDLVNKSQHIRLPVISVFVTNIRRDESRIFNKVEGPFYSLDPTAAEYEFLGQPVPVNVTMNMSIITRFQTDLDQILTNFIPYTDPYVVVSWKMPVTDLEIRSHIVWDGNVSIQEPTDISHTDYYRQTADTSFQIEGWLFKKPKDPIGKIYTIDTSFAAVSTIADNLDLLQAQEDEYNTETFYISARPQFTYCDPWLTIPCVSDTKFSLYGKMFDYTTSLYVSGSPGVFANTTLIDPMSGNSKVSALYPAFSGIELSNWNIESQYDISFTMPSAVSAGYVDVLAANEAGYGKLTVDAWRPTTNPYPSGSTEYDNYIEYQHPSVSGIRVAPFYYNCN